MWKESEDLISIIDQNIHQYQQDILEFNELNENDETIFEQFNKESVILPTSQVETLYYLEKGLCYHYFDYQDKVNFSSFLNIYISLYISFINIKNF